MAPHVRSPTGDWTSNPSMCSNQESNPCLSGLQDNATNVLLLHFLMKYSSLPFEPSLAMSSKFWLIIVSFSKISQLPSRALFQSHSLSFIYLLEQHLPFRYQNLYLFLHNKLPQVWLYKITHYLRMWEGQGPKDRWAKFFISGPLTKLQAKGWPGLGTHLRLACGKDFPSNSGGSNMQRMKLDPYLLPLTKWTQNVSNTWT